MHVDLQFIELIILERIQGRIAASEIIHPDLEAGPVEFRNHLAHQLLLLSHEAFGDLNIDQAAGNLIKADCIVHFLENIAERKIQTGQVDRDRDRNILRIQYSADQSAYLPDDAYVKAVDQLVLFKDGYELIRTDDSVLGIHPPGKRFKSAEFSGNGTYDGLKIWRNVMSFNRSVKMIQYILFQISGHASDLLPTAEYVRNCLQYYNSHSLLLSTFMKQRKIVKQIQL